MADRTTEPTAIHDPQSPIRNSQLISHALLRSRARSVVSILGGFLAIAAVTVQSVAADPPIRKPSPRQDGRFIPRLRWVSPHDELPGTYARYLQQRPPRRADFSNRRMMTPPSGVSAFRGRPSSTVSILVDSALHPSITTGLDQYVADLMSEGYSVFTETVSGGTSEDIKAWVQARYSSGSEEIVFVGDITAAWAEVSGDVFPCDLFYMDVDGHWEDADFDGDYEIHNAGSGDEGPEVYVARMQAHTLNYDTEPNMVNGYFGKAHAYRTGSLTQPWRGLEYIDEDWYTTDVDLDLVYEDDVVRHDYGYFTTATDYLNQIDLGQHFVQVCAHSYSGGHIFGTRPTQSAAYTHVYVYSPSTRSAKLLLGCDDGIKVWLNGSNVFTWNFYYLGWQPDLYTVNVTLNAGWNRLLCKVSQEGGVYQFSARFTDTGLATFPDLEYQLSDPDVHGREAPFIRAWLLNGFHQDISDNFWSYLTTNYLGVSEDSINPQNGDPMGGQTWTAYESSDSLIDLEDYCGYVDFGVCYAFARVYADANTSGQLWLGYDDGARVWLNGQEVLCDNRCGGFEADMTKVNVTLNAGENRLLIKVSEWVGPYGFSARFCRADGSLLGGLTYDPEPAPISYIGTWLVNGPYVNPDWFTRLSHDYLGGESGVRPNEGDSAPFGTWEAARENGYPFDIGVFYDHGEWVFSQTIQDRDPPVLFYNLFACGAGRFTDSNYLAGAYIFNTTYGLITVASTKSGSMLNFDDFTGPLGEGKTIGRAYLEWFKAQAPFELWEREWYYGMILNGDPTLRSVVKGDRDRDGDVDLGDYAVFHDCLAGPSATPAPTLPGVTTEECRGAFDFDQDDDVDLDDFAGFQGAFTG